ncbi:MAG: phosphatase PAP2 family protein [Methylobacter sp.]
MPTQINLEFDRFIKSHFAVPLMALILFSGLEFTGLDLWISRHFYDAELHQWIYKESLLAGTILHTGGQYLIYLSAIVLLVSLLASFRSNSSFHHYQRELVFLLVASISGPVIIALLKRSTHIYCPWDVALFGGDKPYVRLFDNIPNNLVIGYCFPAAHAGSGFTFISLYFFLVAVKPKYKRYGLYFGLALGFVFGAAQQARGAHFFSHDVFALAVCWFSSLILFILFFRKQLKWA